MSEIPADLADAVRDRYTLRRVLGKGGMATVYLAHDRKHLRDVAVKVLRPDLAASIGSDRFLKEIQIAARLTHPHILALHDSGEERGFLYYVMPFIDGPSLRQRLVEERRLEPAEALEIAAPVADALSYAHRMGFFHRDIKPENILFSQGHPIVADFGIAKAVSTAGGANLTRTGFPLGTPGYMSPEQAAGLTDLDERTDVYSLAVVIYEMLVGDIPGMWPSEEAVRTGRFLEATPSHRSRLAQVGGKIEEALVRGLSIRYEERTANPAQLMDELTGRAAPSPIRRKYSEEQVREIVKRAAEIEASNPTASGAMTIGGIEQIAKDVGIAPEIVRQAVDVVSAKPFATLPAIKTKRNWFIGGPTRIVFERTVDGEVPEAEFPVMVDEIRRVLQHVGQVAQLGRSFSWNTTQGRGGGSVGRNIEIAVTVRGGRTRIIAQENLSNLIGGVWGGIGGGMGGGGLGPLMAFIVEGLNMRGPGIAMLIPMWLALTYSTARTSYHYATKRRERGLEELADRLAALALELVEEQGILPKHGQRRLIS